MNPCSHTGISELNGSPRSFNNGSSRSLCGSFLLISRVYWLDQHRVSPIFRQPSLTQSLERCHFQFDPLALESEFHLLEVMKTSLKNMWNNDSPVLKVSLKLTKSDPEDEFDKPGTTIGTKFSVLHCIRIPF